MKGGSRGKSGVDPQERSILQLRAELKESEDRRKELEKDLRYARENAEEKTEELSQLIAQTMEYESGEKQLIAWIILDGMNIGFCGARSKQAYIFQSEAWST